MKFDSLVFLLLLIAAHSYGQYTELLRPGTTWLEPNYCDAPDLCHPGIFVGGNVYFVGEDSTFEGEVFKKIMHYPLIVGDSAIENTPCYYFEYLSESPVYSCLMKEDVATQQVYYYDAGADSVVLFYDFSLVVGDTLHYLAFPDFIVTDVSEISINGSNRQVFSNEFGVSYIEGVGGTYGLFQPLTTPISGCWTTPCVRHNGANEHGDCYSFLDNVQYPGFTFNLYPNPVSNDLHIEINQTADIDFRIFSISGQLLFQTTLHGKEGVIHIGHVVEPGTYFCRVNNSQIVPIVVAP